MKLSEIREILKASVIVGEEKLDLAVSAGVASDLMSDLLRCARAEVVILSGLNTVQAVRTVIISGAAALVLVRNKQPDEEMIGQARLHGVPILSTPFTLFTACGRLLRQGLRGVDQKDSSKEPQDS